MRSAISSWKNIGSRSGVKKVSSEGQPMLVRKSGLQRHTISNRDESLLERHKDKLRFLDRWVEAVDEGKVEIRIEALEFRNERLEKEIERERDRRVADAVERDDRQIKLGTAVAERLFELRCAVSPGIAFDWFVACTVARVTGDEKQDQLEIEAKKAIAAAHKQHESTKRAVTKLIKASLANAFEVWWGGADQQKQGRGLCLRVIEQMQHGTQSWALDRWCKAVDQTHEKRQQTEAQVQKQLKIIQRTIARMYKAALSNGFDGWWGNVLKQRQGRKMCGKLIHRMQHASLSRSFDCFWERVEEGKMAKQKLAKALSQWQRPALEFGWNGWLDYLAEESDARAKETRDVNARKMLELEAVMCELGTAREDARIASAERSRQAAEAQAQKQTDTVRRVVGRMMDAALAQAFDCFVRRVDESKHVRQQLARVLVRWKRKALEFGWDGWREGMVVRAREWTDASLVAAKAQKQLQIVRRVIVRMYKAALSNGFDGWLSNVLKQQQGRDTCQKVIHRMQHASLSRSFDCFWERVEEGKRAKKKLTKALSRWQRPALEFGWNGWLDYLAEESDARAKETRDVNARKMLDLEAAMCKLGTAGEDARIANIERSRQAAEAQAQKQMDTARRVVGRMMKVAMAQAFDVFVRRVEQSKHVRQQLTRVLVRWQRPALEFGWDCWSEGMVVEAEKRAKSSMVAAQAQKQLQIVRRVIARMYKAALSNGFDGWLSNVLKQRQGRESCWKVIHRMQHAALSRSFDCFWERVEEGKMAKQKLAKALSRWQRPALEFGWNRWLDYLAEESDARAQECSRQAAEAQTQKQMDTARRVVGKMMDAALAQAFDCFVGRVEDSKHVRQQLARVLVRWQRSALEFGWDSWRESMVVEAEKRANAIATDVQAQKQLQIVRRVIARIYKAALSNGFDGWWSNVLKQQRGRETCGKVIHRMQHASLSRSFDCFWERVEKGKRAKQNLAKALSQWQRPALEFGWNGWLNYIAVTADEGIQAAHESANQCHAEVLLNLQRDIKREREDTRREQERREALLKAEAEQNRQIEALEWAERDAHVMGQLQALEAELAREALKAAKKMQQLDEENSFESPRGNKTYKFSDPMLGLARTASPHSFNGAHGKVYDANGEVFYIGGRTHNVKLTGAGGHHEPKADQLLESHIRLIELRQRRSSLGAKIHAKLADVNLSLEEYNLPLMHSKDLDIRALIRDSQVSSFPKLLSLETELHKQRKSAALPLEHPALKQLKEVRQQQGRHSHYEGPAVLPHALLRGDSMASYDSNSAPRKKEIQELINDLKLSRSCQHNIHGEREAAVYGRDGWFRS